MATIKITAADNELFLVAYQWGNSYLLAHIMSGANNPVNVTLNLSKGQYAGPVTLNGVTQALSSSSAVTLDAGTYSLMAIGVNWGGGISFAVNVDGTNLTFTNSPIKNTDGTVAEAVSNLYSLVVS